MQREERPRALERRRQRPARAGGSAARPGAPTGPLIEREAPLRRLEQAYTAAAEHGGQLALVCGEAGIGKSSLVEAFVAGLPDPAAVAMGWCDPMRTPRPLGPVRDLARRWLGKAVDAPDEIRHFDGLLRRLARRPRGRLPVHVLCLEDLHWADHRSLDWLQFVGRRIAGLPLLLIGTCRDHELPPGHALHTVLDALPRSRLHRIDLAPLSAAGVQALARAAPVGAARTVDADTLQRLSGGNPFFVGELLHREAEPGSPGLPPSLTDVIDARLHDLRPPLRALIERLSCSPAGTPLAMLGHGAPTDLHTQLDELVRLRWLVVKDHQAVFRHDLVRMAVFGRLPAARQREGHRQLLEALLDLGLADTMPELAVHHARGAGDDDRTLIWAPRAAQRAAAYGAHREAADHLAAARAVARDVAPALAADLHERWAYEAAIAQGLVPEVLAARREAARLWEQAGRPDKVGENLASLARMHRYRGEATQAQAYVEQAVSLLASQPPSSAQAQAFALRAHVDMLHDRMDDALAWGRRALEVAEAADDVATRSHALNTMGSARLLRGDAGGEALLRESLALALRHDLHEHAARVYTNLAEGLIELRALDRAEAVMAEGLAYDSAHDFQLWLQYLIGRQAQLRFEQDRYAEALQIAAGVLGQDSPMRALRLPALIVHARVTLRLGHPDAARHGADALAEAERIGEPQYLVSLRLAQMESAVLSGAPRDAAPADQALMRLGLAAMGPRKVGEWCLWRHLVGLPPPLELDSGRLPPAHQAWLAGDFGAAAQAFDGEGSRYLGAWARVAQARAADGQASGGSLRQQAAQTFERLQALPAQQAVAAPPGAGGPGERPPATIDRDASRSLLAVGPAMPSAASRGPYAAARSHPYGLTAREQQVLALVAAGQDNAGIARTLQRSQRTVENHVSAVLSKLQARHRLDLVLRVQREPWIVAPAADGTAGPADPH